MAAFDDEVLHLGTAPDENQLRTIEAIEDFLQDDYLFDSDAGEDIDFEEDSDDEEEELRPPPATVEAAPSSSRAGLSVSQVRRKMVFLGSHAELKEEIKSMIAALENPSQAAAASSSSSGFDLKPDTAELDSWKMLLAQIDNNAALSGLSDGGQPSSSAPVLDQLAPMRASLRASSTVAKAALPPLDDEVKQLLSRQRARTRLARSSVTLRQNDGEQQKKLGRRALVSSAPHTAPDRHERNIDSAPEQHNPEADRAPAADGAAEPDYVDRWCNFCYEMSEPDPSLKGSTCDCLDLSTQLCRSCVIVCLERYLDTGSRFLPSNCPICATPIDVEEFAERLLTPENFARFQHHRMLLLLRTNSSYTRCRDPRCEKVIKVGELVCSHCQAQFCPDCDLLAHPDQTCAQYRRQLRRVRPRATFGSVVRNAASKLSVKMRTTACAKCGVRVQKNGGCKHMTCSNCRYEWCWKCHGEWKSVGGYGHWCFMRAHGTATQITGKLLKDTGIVVIGAPIVVAGGTLALVVAAVGAPFYLLLR